MSAPLDDGPRAESAPRPAVWRRPVAPVVAALALVALVVVLVIFQPQRLLYDVTVDDEFPTAGEDDGASEGPADASGVQADGDVGGPVEEEASDRSSPEGDSPEESGDELDDPSEEPLDGDEGDPPGEAGDDEGDPDEGGPAAGAPEAEQPTAPLSLSTGSFESRNRYTTTGTATAFELPDGTRTLRLADFETTNGPDLYVYLTVADAAESDTELDANVVDLGALRGNVGNQNYPIPDDVDLDLYDTVVIWCLRFTTSFGVADLVG